MYSIFNYIKQFKYNKISGLVALILSFTSLVGLVIMLDKRWAYREDLLKLEQKLDYKICMDQYNGVQYRIWRLEDRYKNITKMNQLAKEEYRSLTRQLKNLQCKNFLITQVS